MLLYIWQLCDKYFHKSQENSGLLENILHVASNEASLNRMKTMCVCIELIDQSHLLLDNHVHVLLLLPVYANAVTSMQQKKGISKGASETRKLASNHFGDSSPLDSSNNVCRQTTEEDLPEPPAHKKHKGSEIDVLASDSSNKAYCTTISTPGIIIYLFLSF